MSASEVPFRDFLTFLFHSASNSPSATRVNSSSFRPMSITAPKSNPFPIKTPPKTKTYGRKVRKRSVAPSVPEDLGRLNILIHHQVSSVPKLKKRNQVLPKVDNFPDSSILQQDHNDDGTFSAVKTTTPDNKLAPTDIKDTSDILIEKESTAEKDAEPNSVEDPSENKKIRPQSKSTGEDRSYHELLNEYLYNQSDSIDNNIDFQYDTNHLCVHDSHDLSFYKNFSATTRSKSSLAYLFSKSTTHCKQHYHQEIICSLSKRLSRSIPIKLDVLTFTNSSSENGDDSTRSNGDDEEDSQPYSNEDDNIPTSCQKSTNPSTACSVNSENHVQNSEIPIKTTKRFVISNSQSSPTLNVMGMDVNYETTPRRINTSIPSCPEGLVSKHTVRVTMDTSSLFLDAVYVNMKQDVDSSATIKLFY